MIKWLRSKLLHVPVKACQADWSGLPQPAVVLILCHMTRFQDRYHASLVCSSWRHAYTHPRLWRHVHVTRDVTAGELSAMACDVTRVGQHVRVLHVQLPCSASDVILRHTAQLLCCLATSVCLRQVVIHIETRCCFYDYARCVSAGVYDAILGVLIKHISLEHIDIRVYGIDLSKLTEVITKHNTHLRTVNIDDMSALSSLHSRLSCLSQLLVACRHVTHMYMTLTTPLLNRRILQVLSDETRVPLQHLRVAIGDVFGVPHEGEVSQHDWNALIRKSRDLKLDIGVHQKAGDQHDLAGLLELHGLDGELPVTGLHIERSTDEQAVTDMYVAAQHFGCSVQTVSVDVSVADTVWLEDDTALLHFTASCHNLRVLYILGNIRLNQSTINTILQQHPRMRREKTYYLPE